MGGRLSVAGTKEPIGQQHTPPQSTHYHNMTHLGQKTQQKDTKRHKRHNNKRANQSAAHTPSVQALPQHETPSTKDTQTKRLNTKTQQKRQKDTKTQEMEKSQSVSSTHPLSPGINTT